MFTNDVQVRLKYYVYRVPDTMRKKGAAKPIRYIEQDML
jgi:hypothetical protein